MELLTSVRVVARSLPQLQALSHVLWAINEFSDASALWTIESAASKRLLSLLDRLLARESSAAHVALGEERFAFGTHNAAANGRVDVLKWWTSCYRPERRLGALEVFDLAQEAASIGHLEVLEWLHSEYTLPSRAYMPNSEWKLASDHADVVYWLHEQALDVPVNVSLVQVDRPGHLAFMQWLFQRQELYSVHFDYKLLTNAVELSDLDMIQWLLKTQLFESSSELFLGAHCSFGSSAWILEKRWPRGYYSVSEPCFYLPDPLEVTEAHLRVFRWLNTEYKWKHRQYRDQWINCVALHAASCNSFEMIQVLEGIKVPQSRPLFHRQILAKTDRLRLPMWLAAFHGHLEMVQWLHAQGGKLNANDCMEGAAAGGQLEIVQWLQQNQPYDSYGPSKEIMDVAAWNGHLDILQWLHYNAPEYSCTENAMDMAAAQGHLPVVQWLHANRSEGCTRKAMDGAVENGHLEVVQWLFGHRYEGFSQESADKAIASGRVEIVEFIHRNWTEFQVASSALVQVAGNGHLGMIQWLQANVMPIWPQDALDAAASNVQEAVVKYLAGNCKLHCGQQVIDYACRAGLFGLAEWVLVHGLIPELPSTNELAPVGPL